MEDILAQLTQQGGKPPIEVPGQPATLDGLIQQLIGSGVGSTPESPGMGAQQAVEPPATLIERVTRPAPKVDEVDKFVDLLSNKDGGKWEGSVKKLDVPKHSEKSGATVATGFDLGQINEAGLKKLGFPKELNDKLKPYLGLKGDAARKALVEKPLTLTDSEVKTINRSVVAKTIRDAKGRMADASAWNDMTETEKFATIAAQHQYGSGTQLPVQFGNRDWDAARNNLNTWSDKTKKLGASIEAKYKGLVSEIDQERVVKKSQAAKNQ